MSLKDQFEEMPDGIESEDVKELRNALMRVQKQLKQSKERNEDLVFATKQAAYDAMLTFGKVMPVPEVKIDKRKTKGEVALWHMTDWQGAKRTVSYNSEIMRDRVLQFATKAVAITEIQRADHPVKDVTIAFGGDMVEGLFNFPTQAFEVDSTLFEQYVNVSRLIVDVVRFALANYEKVTVVPEWGNHGRIGSKRDNVPRSDNFDRMCYELAKQLLAGEKRLTWQDCPEDIQRIEIGNYRALLMHGDEVGRSGFASPAGWQAAGNRWKAGAYDWEFQDIYLGHYHRHAQEPLSDGLGSVYWTGSTESDNRYARDSMAASGVPSQRLHFIDPERGRVTACYQVWLD
jgi:hypothetical protein